MYVFRLEKKKQNTDRYDSKIIKKYNTIFCFILWFINVCLLLFYYVRKDIFRFFNVSFNA